MKQKQQVYITDTKAFFNGIEAKGKTLKEKIASWNGAIEDIRFRDFFLGIIWSNTNGEIIVKNIEGKIFGGLGFVIPSDILEKIVDSNKS